MLRWNEFYCWHLLWSNRRRRPLQDFDTPIRSPGNWILLGRRDLWNWRIMKGARRC